MNKYLHTVASVGFLFTLKVSTWNVRGIAEEKAEYNLCNKITLFAS